VQPAGDKLFAGAVFARDQYARLARRHLVDQLADVFHLRRGADDLFRMHIARTARAACGSGRGCAGGCGRRVVDGAVYGLQQAVHVDGLGEVILRTVAYGFDRRVDRRFRRKNDERDSGVGNLAAPVRKDDVERYFLAHRRCSLLIFGGFGREAFEFETLAERVSHTF